MDLALYLKFRSPTMIPIGAEFGPLLFTERDVIQRVRSWDQANMGPDKNQQKEVCKKIILTTAKDHLSGYKRQARESDE